MVAKPTITVKKAKFRKPKRVPAIAPSEIEHIEKEKYNLNVMSQMLKEKEEMIALHEQKVISLKAGYERKHKELEGREQEIKSSAGKIREIKSQEAKLAAQLEKMKKEHQISEALLLARHKEEEKLKDAHMRLQIQISQKARELKEYQNRFDNLHNALPKLDLQLRKKRTELEKTDYQLQMRAHEFEDLQKQTRKAKTGLERILGQITHNIEKEIEVLADRVEDHAKHNDMQRATQDYDKIRHLYGLLSRKEKKKVYKQIQKIAAIFR